MLGGQIATYNAAFPAERLINLLQSPAWGRADSGTRWKGLWDSRERAMLRTACMAENGLLCCACAAARVARRAVRAIIGDIV